MNEITASKIKVISRCGNKGVYMMEDEWIRMALLLAVVVVMIVILKVPKKR